MGFAIFNLLGLPRGMHLHSVYQNMNAVKTTQVSLKLNCVSLKSKKYFPMLHYV